MLIRYLLRSVNVLVSLTRLPLTISLIASSSLLWLFSCACHSSVRKSSLVDVSFTQLCDDQKGIVLDRKKKKKYGTGNPYNINETRSNDTSIISFDFITKCCGKFSGDIKIERDTLTLYYYFVGREVCDCFCDYRMTYKILPQGVRWNKMIIKEALESTLRSR